MFEILENLMLVFLGGVFTIPAYLHGRKRRVANIDYKERWQSVLDLLSSEGKATDDQIRALKGFRSPVFDPPAVSRGYADDMEALYAMESGDRVELEVDRLNSGFAPRDDMRDLDAWEIADIMKARNSADKARQTQAEREKKDYYMSGGR